MINQRFGFDLFLNLPLLQALTIYQTEIVESVVNSKRRYTRSNYVIINLYFFHFYSRFQFYGHFGRSKSSKIVRTSRMTSIIVQYGLVLRININ